jgi:type I restriction enzyme S subunit
MLSEWPRRRLGEFASLCRGLSYSTEQLRDGGFPFVTLKSFERGGGYRSAGLKSYVGPLLPACRLYGGELLIANTDLTRDAVVVGAPAIAPSFSDGPACFSMDVSRLFVDSTVADNRYLFYRMQMRDVRSFMQARAAGSTVLHLHVREVPSLPLNLPPLPEQTRIAAILDTLDDTIRQTEQVIAKLQQMKQGLLHDLLTRGIDENGEVRDPEHRPYLFKDSVLGRIPRGWDVRKLCEVTTRITDGTHQAVVTVDEDDDTVPFLFVSCVRDGLIHWSKGANITSATYREICRGREPVAGMLLYTAVGSYGHAAVVLDDRKFAFQRHLACIYPNESLLSPAYCGHWLNGPQAKRHADNVALGNAQKTVTLGVLSHYPIAMPALSEQKTIAAVLADADRTIEREFSEVGKLLVLKQGLMDDLLTGRVRTPATIEVAA